MKDAAVAITGLWLGMMLLAIYGSGGVGAVKETLLHGQEIGAFVAAWCIVVIMPLIALALFILGRGSE